MRGGWEYPQSDVLEGARRDEGEADEEDVGLRVAECSQSVVLLLTGCIPEPASHRDERHKSAALRRKSKGTRSRNKTDPRLYGESSTIIAVL
jgi:hypothetical protein